MNIVFFTPVLEQSAIAGVGFVVVNALIKLHHTVTVVRTEKPDLYHLPAYSYDNTFFDWQDEATITEIIKKADIIIYQIGDCYQFHAGCLYWFNQFPGILILHDYFLGSLF